METTDSANARYRLWARDDGRQHLFVWIEDSPYCGTCGGSRSGVQHIVAGLPVSS